MAQLETEDACDAAEEQLAWVRAIDQVKLPPASAIQPATGYATGCGQRLTPSRVAPMARTHSPLFVSPESAH